MGVSRAVQDAHLVGRHVAGVQAGHVGDRVGDALAEPIRPNEDVLLGDLRQRVQGTDPGEPELLDAEAAAVLQGGLAAHPVCLQIEQELHRKVVPGAGVLDAGVADPQHTVTHVHAARLRRGVDGPLVAPAGAHEHVEEAVFAADSGLFADETQLEGATALPNGETYEVVLQKMHLPAPFTF